VKLSSLSRSSVTSCVGTVARAGQDGKGAFGQAGLGQHFTDDQRTHGSGAGRLEHERTAGGNGRRDLVRHQVQGKLNGLIKAQGPIGTRWVMPR
jgi:hypothetical protein